MSTKSKYVYEEMKLFGIFLWLVGSIKMYKDGDLFSPMFRWWHPITWFCFVLVLIPCAVVGEKITTVVPLKLKDFWKQNKEQLQWVKPWTRIDSLKPFIWNK